MVATVSLYYLKSKKKRPFYSFISRSCEIRQRKRSQKHKTLCRKWECSRKKNLLQTWNEAGWRYNLFLWFCLWRILTESVESWIFHYKDWEQRLKIGKMAPLKEKSLYWVRICRKWLESRFFDWELRKNTWISKGFQLIYWMAVWINLVY